MTTCFHRLSRRSAWSRLRVIVFALAPLLGAAAVAGRVQQPAWRAAAVASFDDAWRTIADSYYDTAFGGLDWPAVRDELRPRVASAASPDDARRVIREMLGRLKQSHFVLMSSAPDDQSLPGEAIVPIDVRVSDAGALITRADPPARLAGLRAGQRLTGIDGQDIRTWLDVSNGADRRVFQRLAWQRIFRALHGPSDSVAVLTIRDGDDVERTVRVARLAETGASVTVGNLPPMRVRTSAARVTTPTGRQAGLIGFNVWMTAVAEPFARAIDEFRDASGIVVDLRGNPGGLAEMIRGIGGHFFVTSELLGTVHMRGVALEFRVNPRMSTSDGRRVAPFAGPVALLVDELTASASECFAGGMQSLGRARVFGTQTMGQALPAVTRRLPNGDVLMYAVGDFVTATGRRLEGDGVLPDEMVPLSPAALAFSSDPALDRALQWIDAQASGR